MPKKNLISADLLRKLRDVLSESREGQERLDKTTKLITESLEIDVCSIYLLEGNRQFELCSTYGLTPSSVHKTKLRRGEGLVGRVAETGQVINTPRAIDAPGYAYRPETGEEIYYGFCGIPLQRFGRVMGVLVVQTRESRIFTNSEVATLEIVATVLVEMSELGAFTADIGGAMVAPHKDALVFHGKAAQSGMAIGAAVLHDPYIVVSQPVAENPEEEQKRLANAFEKLEADLANLSPHENLDEETRDIIATFQSLSRDRGLRRRLEIDVAQGLASEAAVEKEQSRLRARINTLKDPYIRARIADIDDLTNRLMRILVGAETHKLGELPENAIIVARDLGPAELLEYGRGIKGIVLAEGSVASHVAIIARAWTIPLIVRAGSIHLDARDGDVIAIDTDSASVHLRPEESILKALSDKVDMRRRTQATYGSIRDLPAITQDGVRVHMLMNAGLMPDLPSLFSSGAEGVGLYRTELQFLTKKTVPKRHELSDHYATVLDSAQNRPVTFRTLDIGSDKVLPYLNSGPEKNPALGWRAIRLTIDRPTILRMQIQAFLRAARGRDIRIMFPFVAQQSEFDTAKNILHDIQEEHIRFGYSVPKKLDIGAMLETPSLAFASDSLFRAVDFFSVGGNDLKQFFFAADRENEYLRQRYDTLNASFLKFLKQIITRCDRYRTPVSFCGEDAGKPLEALALVAIGFRILSIRAASIGAVKHLIRQVNLVEVRRVMEKSMAKGDHSVRDRLTEYLAQNSIFYENF